MIVALLSSNNKKCPILFTIRNDDRSSGKSLSFNFARAYLSTLIAYISPGRIPEGRLLSIDGEILRQV